MTSKAKYMADQIGESLAGARIVQAMITPDEDAFGFVAKLPDGSLTAVWVSCDAEANGPGWLHIEPVAADG